jgi:hypothetical protein
MSMKELKVMVNRNVPQQIYWEQRMICVSVYDNKFIWGCSRDYKLRETRGDAGFLDRLGQHEEMQSF